MNFEKLAQQFLEASHQFRKNNHQKKVDETLRGETFLILYVMKRGGSVLPSEISDAMNITSARVAAVLNSLEGKNLITRQIDPSDRRKILVNITEEGKEIARNHQELALGVVTRMLEKLGEQDARELVRIMNRLAVQEPDNPKED